MEKKIFATPKDKEDWDVFTKDMGTVVSKDADKAQREFNHNKVIKLDLHGQSLIEANKLVEEFITKSFESGYRKLLIVTGKGSRSKSYDNPYSSEKLSVLKNSIPEYIKNNKELNSKIISISKADQKDGGEGALYIQLKKIKE